MWHIVGWVAGADVWMWGHSKRDATFVNRLVPKAVSFTGTTTSTLRMEIGLCFRHSRPACPPQLSMARCGLACNRCALVVVACSEVELNGQSARVSMNAG